MSRSGPSGGRDRYTDRRGDYGDYGRRDQYGPNYDPYVPGPNDYADYYVSDRAPPPPHMWGVAPVHNDTYIPPNSSADYNAPYEQQRGYHSSATSPRRDRGDRAWTPSAPAGGSSPVGAYVPPRFRRPSPTYSSSPSYGHGGGGPRRAKKEDFVPHLPPAHYIELSREPVRAAGNPVPKLLVLDLNGALLYRAPSGGGASRRQSYPRPFLHNFLAYLMLPEPNGDASPYEVLVWSSAQPQNVRTMVETTFGKWCDGVWNEKPVLEGNEKRLLDVWARDKMNLGNDYHHNVQTTKDLRDVIKIVDRYDERSVLLLDDSPFKATEQPWSHIIVPEYEKIEYNAAGKVAYEMERDGTSISAVATSKAMDNSLLAVIGILEAMAHQLNIPAWVRSGAIEFPLQDPLDTSAEVTLETLPSSATFNHWFQNPETHAYWVEAGIAALKRKGIPLEHGITPQIPQNASKKGKGKRGDTPRGNAADYTTYDGLLAITRNVSDADQRAILNRALDVLEDLGYGPSRSAPGGELHVSTEAHSQCLPSDLPSDVSQPLRAKKRKAIDPLTDPTDDCTPTSPGTRIPSKYERAAESRKASREQLGEAVEEKLDDPLTLPIEFRPGKMVFNWLRRLTVQSYEASKRAAESLQRKIACDPPKNDDKLVQYFSRKDTLDELMARLNLIVVPPTSIRYDTMLDMYGKLPPAPSYLHDQPIYENDTDGRPHKRHGNPKYLREAKLRLKMEKLESLRGNGWPNRQEEDDL